MERTSSILNLAADLIQERGWGQGCDTWTNPDGALCIEGAIAAAMGKRANRGGDDGIWPEDIQICPAGAAVREYLQWDAAYLYMWNDEQRWEAHVGLTAKRTASEVVEVLRAAALIEASRESQDAAFATYAQNVAAS